MLDINSIKIKNKKGQVSETITWIVALLIIIFILGSSIFLSSQIAKTKKFISVGELNKNKVLHKDLLLQQSVFAFFQKDSGERMDLENKIEKLDKEDNFRGDFNLEINKLSENLK